jgi:hypothetical protein
MDTPKHFVEEPVLEKLVCDFPGLLEAPFQHDDARRGRAYRLRRGLHHDVVPLTQPSCVDQTSAAAQCRNREINGAFLDEDINPLRDGRVVPPASAS